MKSNSVVFLLMLAFFFSCEGEKIDYSIINRSISVTARIEGSKTRAANDSWSEGDVIGIYMLTAGELLSNESVLSKNAGYTTQGDGFFTPVNAAAEIKLPMDGSNVDFIAYYPQGTVSAAYEYSVDVADQGDPAAIDLLYADNAKALNKASQVVNFNFSHQLSKVIVNLTADDGSPLSDVTVTIKGLNTKGKFSLIDKTLTTSAKANIRMNVSSNATAAEAIVLPAASLTGATLEITNARAGYTYNLAAATNITAFEAGYKYTYNVTFDTSEAVSADASISAWTEGPAENLTLSKSFDVYEPVGAGTHDDPFTVEDVRNMTDLSGVWAIGYIAGYYTSSSLASFSNDLTSGSVVNTKLALAASPTETLGANTAPVQLPAGSIRDELNLLDHPENLGKQVLIKGTLATYNGGPGISSPTAYEFVSP